MILNIIDKIDEEHLSHYWYGGECATIKHKGFTFSIQAIGDICCEYQKGENYEFFKDKNNSGRFYNEMNNYIKSDSDLYDAMERKELIFDYNNWWECFVCDENEKFYDLMWALDSIRLDDAIEEVKGSIEETIEYIKNLRGE